MKNLVLIGMLLIGSIVVNGQSVSLTYTTSNLNGSYSPGYVLASWIENSSNTWVKTVEKYGDDRYTSLLTWKAKTGAISTANRYNTTDATTGSTLSTYTAHTATWNCKNISQAIVPSGNYSFNVEYTSNDLTQGPLLTVPFTIGTSNQHVTPANTNNFSNIVLDFTASTAAINDVTANQSISVFPIPSNGVYSVSFQTEEIGDGIVTVTNELGKVIKSFTVSQSSLNAFEVDITNAPAGIYFIEVSVNKRVISQKVTKIWSNRQK